MSRPDNDVVSPPKYDPHPAGQHVLLCVDYINLGERIEQFPGQPEKISPKGLFVFQSGLRNKEGRLHEVSMEVTKTLGKKAKLRALIEDWAGRSFEDKELEDFALNKLVGKPALCSVEHKTSKSGRTYAAIKTIAPVPAGLPTPTITGYERPEFFAERIAEYAKQVAEFRAKTAPSTSFEEVPAGLDENNDDLPF